MLTQETDTFGFFNETYTELFQNDTISKFQEDAMKMTITMILLVLLSTILIPCFKIILYILPTTHLHLKIKTFSKIKKFKASGLSQFLTTESPVHMMKNAFYFTLKAHFIFMIFKLLSGIFWSCMKTA